MKVGHRQTNPSKSALSLQKTQGAFTSTTHKTNATSTKARALRRRGAGSGVGCLGWFRALREDARPPVRNARPVRPSSTTRRTAGGGLHAEQHTALESLPMPLLVHLFILAITSLAIPATVAAAPAADRLRLGVDPRVRQLRSQVRVFARAHFQKCHYSSANCSGTAGFSIPNA